MPVRTRYERLYDAPSDRQVLILSDSLPIEETFLSTYSGEPVSGLEPLLAFQRSLDDLIDEPNHPIRQTGLPTYSTVGLEAPEPVDAWEFWTGMAVYGSTSFYSLVHQVHDSNLSKLILGLTILLIVV